MTNDMRCLADAEIDTVSGGFFVFLATMVGSCIEYNLHGSDSGSESQETDTAGTGNTEGTGDTGDTGDTK